ncbi:MAG: hypothetical protein FWC55_05565, partial [Firmicutes bacterium]|nr:hypothetical protein [Bacillota bacterium]
GRADPGAPSLQQYSLQIVERRAGVGAPYNKRNSNFMQKYFHAFVVKSISRQLRQFLSNPKFSPKFSPIFFPSPC